MTLNDLKKLMELITPAALEVLEKIFSRGFVEDCARVNIDGNKGWLVWDYILYNEITFLDDSGAETSLYTSFSDSEARTKFDTYKEKYEI